jgi:hypothetical protein
MKNELVESREVVQEDISFGSLPAVPPCDHKLPGQDSSGHAGCLWYQICCIVKLLLSCDALIFSILALSKYCSYFVESAKVARVVVADDTSAIGTFFVGTVYRSKAYIALSIITLDGETQLTSERCHY